MNALQNNKINMGAVQTRVINTDIVQNMINVGTVQNMILMGAVHKKQD